ncbi:MAG: VOC family protein [Ignavibacteria bacterium]|nr:VOC family protein [Ignavibacteria bacterium]
MANINPYIHFNGNANEAFEFYKSVFGGEFSLLVRFKDMANTPGFPNAKHEENKILHVALPIGKFNVLMGSDIPEVMGTVSENENRSKIYITAESKAEADKLFNSLTEGGTIEIPISESTWGSYFGMLRDKFGIEWMVDFPLK